MLTGVQYRYDRNGRKTLVTSDQTKLALTVLQASIEREARESRESLKIRQDAGLLTPGECLLSQVFGEI